MSQELVPELHDIGKLVDWSSLGHLWECYGKKRGQRFQVHSHDPGPISQLGLPEPTNLTWYGIRFHQDTIKAGTSLACPPAVLKGVDLYERKALWLLIVADHLAGSISRSLRRRFEEEELKRGLLRATRRERFCLWRPLDSAQPERTLPVADASTFRELMTFLSSNPTWAETKARYGNALGRTPEDKGFPRQITSLLTHCELVGRFHRILDRCSSLDTTKQALVYNGTEARTVGEIESGWQFRLLKVAIRFAQRPLRTKDLGVFALIHDGLEQIVSDATTRDYLLLNTLDTMWLFLPIDTPLQEAVRPLLERGFWVEADEAIVPLNMIDANFERMKGCVTKKRAYRPNLPTEIKAPICELCQTAPAEANPIVDEDSGIEEHLCPICHSTRKGYGGWPLFDLGHSWEQENAPVAWVRVRLDYDVLEGILTELFRDYVSGETKRLNAQDEMTHDEREKIVRNLRQVAPSVDFTDDYLHFARGFVAALEDTHRSADHVQAVSPGDAELIVVRIESGEDVLAIASLFAARMSELFPNCTARSPIKLGISVSNAKHPFFDHWQYLEELRDAINLRVVGRGPSLELSIRQFQNLTDLRLGQERASSALHRAAAIERRWHSTILAEVDLLANLRKGSGLHHALLRGFSVSQLLSYHNLATWR